MRIVKGLFRFVIGLLILETVFAIHEYGHLKEFQKNKIPVKEFSLGIGWLVYQYQAKDFALSFRAIPIAAYVSPTKKGEDLIKDKLSRWDKVVIYSAGVRNNIMTGLVLVLCLQVLGWKRGKLRGLEFAQTIVYTPAKLILCYFAFIIRCLTGGFVRRFRRLGEKFCLSTGGINPPKRLKWFIRWNLALGLFNLVPAHPLDGGGIAQEAYSLFITNPTVMAALTSSFWGIYFIIIACNIGLPILQADLKD